MNEQEEIPLSRMERAGRYFYTHPGTAAITALASLLVIATAIGVTFFRGEDTRDTAIEIQRIVTHSACKQDPKGAECQQILLDSIKAFDHQTIGVLVRKLERYERQGREQNSSTNQSTGGNDAPGPASRDVGDQPGSADAGDGGDPGTGSDPPPASGSPDSPGSGQSPGTGAPGGSDGGDDDGDGGDGTTTTPPATSQPDPIDQVTDGLNDAVHGVQGLACGVTGLHAQSVCP